MKYLVLTILYCASFVFAYNKDSTKLTLPLIYNWNKRTDHAGRGSCKDPTEPFQCVDSSHCISLQFLCDGSPGDCPNNTDEDESLCTAFKRPAKDFVEKFFMVQYTQHGSKYFEYLFGKEFTEILLKNPTAETFRALASGLVVSPTVTQFSNLYKMNPLEKERFKFVLESIHNGQLQDLPKYIVASNSDGLSTLADQLIKTHFLDENK